VHFSLEKITSLTTTFVLGSFITYVYFKIRRYYRYKKLKSRRIININMINELSLSNLDSTLIKNKEDLSFLKENYNLTNREKEMLEVLITGISYLEIAQKFKLTEKTISKHASNIFQKTNCKNKKELISLFNRQTIFEKTFLN